MMKNVLKIGVLLAVSLIMESCANSDRPNYQFMPDMYKPVGYETYGNYDVFANGQEAGLPVEGTIPRGWMPYEYENTTEGLELARIELKNPFPRTQANRDNGKYLYDIYCALCHGKKGDGKGILSEREKFSGIPSYGDPGRNITEGSIYHVEIFGLNNMGSYASQTNEKERWQIGMYVEDLMAELKGTEKFPIAVEVVHEVSAVEKHENNSHAKPNH